MVSNPFTQGESSMSGHIIEWAEHAVCRMSASVQDLPCAGMHAPDPLQPPGALAMARDSWQSWVALPLLGE